MARPLIPPPRSAAPGAVRALIAERWLGAREGTSRIGCVELLPHQRAALDRLRRLLRDHGGALLADEVGLGKTYVAAALAREHRRALVVAPAALRAMWRDALRDTGAEAGVTSYTTLSRGRVPAGEFDLLVLDEAHHARTPSTRRYARLAALARRARVLLLSATPVHNAARDLAALFALFLGARAWGMDHAALARLIVRRERADVSSAALPEAGAPRWLPVGDDEALLHEILALPPPLPASDGGDGGALLAWGLVRQWASSRAALAGALRRRLVRAAALESALACGRHPGRAELAAWRGDGHAVQLALPLLAASAAPDPAPLLETVRAHEHAVRALLRRVEEDPRVDDERAACLRELRAAHAGEKIVAFAQYADTATALFRRLRAGGGVAVLTARGALVAGGPLSRREAMARFAPRAHGARAPAAAERIDLLLATDLLGEGVNLQDASVVVHLDLPWTPARLEQRVGRSRRIGARHARTAVYGLAPPAAAEALLRVEDRLRAKLREAERAIGVAGLILPPLAPREPSDASAVTLGEAVAREMERWRGAGGVVATDAHVAPHAAGAAGVAFTRPAPDPVVAVVRAARPFTLVLGRVAGSWCLAGAVDDGAPSEEPAAVLEAVRRAGADASPFHGAELSNAAAIAALGRVERWAAARAGRLAAAGVVPIHAGARRAVLRRIDTITARVPHHRRPELARLAARARRVVTSALGIGAERALAELATLAMPDDAWLRALDAFASANGRSESGEGVEVAAVLIGVSRPTASAPGAPSPPASHRS